MKVQEMGKFRLHIFTDTNFSEQELQRGFFSEKLHIFSPAVRIGMGQACDESHCQNVAP